MDGSSAITVARCRRWTLRGRCCHLQGHGGSHHAEPPNAVVAGWPWNRITCDCGESFATDDEYAEHCGLWTDHFTGRCLCPSP